MKNELRDYSEAVEAHLKALADEMGIKHKVKTTYYTLLRAKEALKIKEKELLEEIERIQ